MKFIQILICYIVFLTNSEDIDEYVPNNHIVAMFGDIIGDIILEMCFPDEFKKKNIAILKYADFQPIEGLSDGQKKEIVYNAYQSIRKPKNPIRNNMTLMRIRLSDLSNWKLF